MAGVKVLRGLARADAGRAGLALASNVQVIIYKYALMLADLGLGWFRPLASVAAVLAAARWHQGPGEGFPHQSHPNSVQLHLTGQCSQRERWRRQHCHK